MLGHALEGTARRAHALNRRDLLAQGQDRLELQGAADPGLCLADPPATLEVLQRVDAEPDLKRIPCLAGARAAKAQAGPEPASI